ncbi:hypothetical protein C8J57DRAFT_1588019, partial [Mycena rebaudengoi]
HFFSTPELVELICKELGYEPVRHKDLAVLARTATIFHTAALDVLWRHQGSPMNVILCMPADLWKFEELEMDHRNFALHRPITPSDLERPLIYSRRMKSLSLMRIADLLPILEVMKPFLPQGILFPNLRQLALRLRLAVDMTIIPYLSLHLVTSIFLRLDSSWSSLPDLPLVYPALKHLEVSSRSQDPACLLASTSMCIRKLIQIEELIVPTLDLLPFYPSYSPLSNPGRAGFPALRSLKTGSMTIGFVTEVVNGFSNTPLRSLSVTTNALGPEHLSEHFFAALSTHLAHSALEEIVLCLGIECKVGSQINGRTLSHLLCFCNFRMVSIFLYGKFLLDDATIWDMARAWPNIVRLDLTSHVDVSGPPPLMTLASLRAFATHCPELATLHLTFDATIIPPSSDEEPVIQKKLSALDVCHSPISSPALAGQGFFQTSNAFNPSRRSLRRQAAQRFRILCTSAPKSCLPASGTPITRTPHSRLPSLPPTLRGNAPKSSSHVYYSATAVRSSSASAFPLSPATAPSCDRARTRVRFRKGPVAVVGFGAGVEEVLRRTRGRRAY